jgi:hypothetical protein
VCRAFFTSLALFCVRLCLGGAVVPPPYFFFLLKGMGNWFAAASLGGEADKKRFVFYRQMKKGGEGRGRMAKDLFFIFFFVYLFYPVPLFSFRLQHGGRRGRKEEKQAGKRRKREEKTY